ncbi:hypothetical protein [Guptibacillus algicola]|uniref:hypothetical protein n=1 Tax=Guptibacillus algicola TaxID=225844 RepID=UPI001CD557EB|nr:hypothetical protein [Alkalihalobacillus algicola]MCA0987923.1 hypothetical protein [Alkalihalobacillus algicola]
MNGLKLAQTREKKAAISSSIIKKRPMMSGKIKEGLIAGTISGIILGFLLKGIEASTGILVYTLLLNIDFIPIIGNIEWPETIEFIFHLIISLAIGVVYSIGSYRYFHKRKVAQVVFSYLLTLPTVFLYFPLTYLAEKPTPPLTDIVAIGYWTLGHAVYAAVLFAVYTYNEK